MPPLIHDVRAARKDLPLYDALHRRTAQVALPHVQQAFLKVTSGEATDLLHKQLLGLQQFVTEEVRPEASADDQLLGALRGYVEDDLSRHGGDDAALVKDLSHEFAVGLWDVLLRQMARNAAGGSTVHRTDLEISAEGDAAGNKWDELDRALKPYALQRQDASDILRAVLTQLRDEATGEQIGLPLGMTIDKAMLIRLLNGEPEPPPHKRGVFETLHDVIWGSGHS